MSPERKALSGQLSDIDLRQLRIFKAVVENRGISAAEVELNISRPAISVAVSDLEQRLGLRLAQRGRAGFALTNEGKEVYESILQLFTSMDTFKSQINALHACLRGDLNIGITDNLVTLVHMNITHALAALKQPGADVRINIRMAPPVDVERGVVDGKLHVGVVPRLQPSPVLDYIPLYDEDSYLYCSDSHPLFHCVQIDPRAITAADTVVSSYAQTSEVKGIEQEFNAAATATDREGIAFLILTGRFIGFLPSHFAERWVSLGKMKRLAPEQFHYQTPYAAITRKGARPNLVVETFLEKLA